MLFDRSALKVEEETPEVEHVAGARVAGDARFVVGKKRADLAQLIGPLAHNEHIHIPSLGAWSMHDVLAYVLQQTGPADVWITSWTITEEPVRSIIELMKAGTIRNLKALFSERVEAMNPSAPQLARFNLQVKLTKIHAKSIVVLNDSWGVTVGGSANFTRNPRIEKYIIATHRELAMHESAWIDAVMEGAEPFRADEREGTTRG
jgi:hypothetical protein